MMLTLHQFLILTSAFLVNAANERVLFDFEGAQDSRVWRPVNDGVMGGRSVGRFKINAEKNLVFFGTLSLENNGGFASVRASGTNLRMAKGESVVLRVRGDGRKYSFNLYSQRNLSGYSFRQKFETKKGEWIEVKLPVDQFRATWRGRSFSNIKLDPKDVQGVSFLLGDKKSGPFQLEVDWIKVRK